VAGKQNRKGKKCWERAEGARGGKQHRASEQESSKYGCRAKGPHRGAS
jgi:hypothetical protein